MATKAINFKLDEKEIHEVRHVAEVYNKSMTDLIKEAIREYLDRAKKDPFYRLTANVEEASPEEESEILEMIEGLSDDDLKISTSKKFNY